MHSKRNGLLALALVGLGGAVTWLAAPELRRALEPFLDANSWRAMREFLRGFGWIAPLASILVSVAQIVPLPIPAPALPLANGWLFGLWGGTLVTWTGVMLNGIVGYWLARGPGRRFLNRWLPAEQRQRAEQVLQKHGGMAVLLARMIPLLPFSAISVAAGLLRMPRGEYLLSTGLGVLPSAFALALIGHQLSRGALDWGQVTVAGTILVGLALAAIPLSRWLKEG